LMAPRHVFMHDDGANYCTNRNFITNRAPDICDDMTKCLSFVTHADRYVR